MAAATNAEKKYPSQSLFKNSENTAYAAFNKNGCICSDLFLVKMKHFIAFCILAGIKAKL